MRFSENGTECEKDGGRPSSERQKKGDTMKRFYILSRVFFGVTVALLCAMCGVVGYSYANLRCAVLHGATSAPAEVAFFLAIPFGIGIAASALLGWVFTKKARRKG